MPEILALKAAVKRDSLLSRCKRDLFFLCTEILGYTLLTREFHEPICKWVVAGQGHTFSWFAAARDHYKTTIQVGDVVRHILIDPNKTHLALHAVDDEVQKFVEEVGQHFLRNKELRKLIPDIRPNPTNRRWLKASEFTVARARYDRQPTLLGKSTGAEITGSHVTGSIRPDDIIGRNTIEDSQLPKVKNWWQNTVMPVRRPGCIVMGSGTRWDINDIYGDWITDKKHWRTWVRAARETDGKPDYKGQSVLYSEAELKLREAQMGASNFAMQMMNDPSPAGDKPWEQERCEHFVEAVELKHPGVYVVISDPAPAKVGSWSGVGEKSRKDGSKDDWATCVVKLRARGQRNEIMLVDGSRSKDWGPDEGWDVVCGFLSRYQGARTMIEAYGGLASEYDRDMRLAARRNGVTYSPIEFKGAYMAKAKNVRFSKLADRAKQDEFLICRTVPLDFLETFLYQARNWRPLETGRNSLKYDDCADCVAMATMEPVGGAAPVPEYKDPNDPWGLGQEAWYEPRSRYCVG